MSFFLSNEQTFPRSSTRDFPSHLIAQTWLTHDSFLHLSLGCGVEVPRTEQLIISENRCFWVHMTMKSLMSFW